MTKAFIYKQGFIQRGGDGGIYPPHDFGKGGISPHQTAEQCFFNGHFSEVLQESVQKTNPLFFSKFVFSNCPPINFFLAETLIRGIPITLESKGECRP